MTKGLVQSSRKKQRLYKNFLKNSNPEKELNYKQYKYKRNQRKTIIQILSIHTNIISKKTRDIMKKIIGNKRVTNAPIPNFITVKNREIFDKKKLRKHLIVILLISVPT